MEKPNIPNRPGPDCDLTIRIKFRTLERFRDDYHQWIRKGRFFLKTSRSKPIGTRVQLIWVLQSLDNMEVWSWGTITNIFSPKEAELQGGDPGLELKLMDITNKRRLELEQLFRSDEAVEAVLEQSRSQPPKKDNVSYTLVSRSEKHELYERIQDMLRMTESADHYVLLGVARNASEDQIREGYQKRSREYHPDRYFNKADRELLDELQKIFQCLTKAYRVLMEPGRRVAYDTSIGNYSNPKAMRNAMPHVKMQKKFRKTYDELVTPRKGKVVALLVQAEQDTEKGNLKAALNKLRLAKAMDPLNSQVKVKLKELQAEVAKKEA